MTYVLVLTRKGAFVYTFPMSAIPRIYQSALERHLANERQMVFLSGPRQVGKTTLCENFQTFYLNWDKGGDRETILAGEEEVAEQAGLHLARKNKPVLTFDELHHYPQWKRFLKGFFDAYGKQAKILVTGSARLNVYKRGGDSLMGRYFPYRMHPLSVGELIHTEICDGEITPAPESFPEENWSRLQTFGGFPEPFSRGDRMFLRRWQRLRFEQLLREDIRKDTAIRELDQIEALARILAERSGEQVVYASLGADVQVNEITVRNWMATLSSFFYGFCIKPWSKHVANAIRKSPKWYLRDWSGIRETGKKNETLVACHLLKAVEFWTDLGFGDYDLFYVRDKQKREVDFLVTRDGNPWFLVEVKTSETALSPSLGHFQQMTGAQHAFQIVFDLPFETVNAFDYTSPIVVSARTFLSQLV